MKTLLLATALLLAITAAPPTRYVFESSSDLYIDGTSSLHDWTCEAERVTGYFETSDPAAPLGAITGGEVSVTATQIDCDNGTMNGKLKRALHTEAHSAIVFAMKSATPTGVATEGWTRLRVQGTLRLAGVSKPLELTARARVLPTGHVQLQGNVSFPMSRFGIDPPSALLGTLKTGDDVTIRFDVVTRALPSSS